MAGARLRTNRFAIACLDERALQHAAA